MASFFSGTDTSTLLKEGDDRNHFVSLIVNNAGTYTAGITRKITRTRDVHDCYKYNSYNDEEVSNCEDYVEEYTSIEWFDLKVTKESVYMPFSDIESRLEEIKKRKSKPATVSKATTAYTKNTYISNPVYKPLDYSSYNSNLFDYDFMDSAPIRNSSPKSTGKDDIIAIAAQLCTTSVISKIKNKQELSNWCSGPMVSMLDGRFKSIKSFETWAETMAEYLLFESIPESCGNDNVYLEVLAGELCDLLDTLPQNKYIIKIKTIIALWT